MEHQLSINFPESLALTLKMGEKEFVDEMKTITLIKLYELGKISSGFAANLLKLNRIDFLELLQKYNVSYFDKEIEDDIENDLANA